MAETVENALLFEIKMRLGFKCLNLLRYINSLSAQMLCDIIFNRFDLIIFCDMRVTVFTKVNIIGKALNESIKHIIPVKQFFEKHHYLYLICI